MKNIMILAIALLLVGCAHIKQYDGQCVQEFGDMVTRSQTAEDKANVAQVKHVLKITNEALAGKLYADISKLCD
jgi:PBP1b-binding outer membrane lipoprotein LpoB